MKTKIICVAISCKGNVRDEVEKINGMKFKNEDELKEFSSVLFKEKGFANYCTSVENLVGKLNDEEYPINEFLAYVYVEE